MNQVPTGDISFQQYSALLLKLYAIARASGVDSFQPRALELICELLPFDGDWWGVRLSTVRATRFTAVPVFSGAERLVLELLAPHLAAALDLLWYSNAASPSWC